MKLDLMFRRYCHLCHDMLSQLKEIQAEVEFEIEVIDIDDDPELLQKYDELVPVLLHEDKEICHWHLDEKQLRAYLTKLS